MGIPSARRLVVAGLASALAFAACSAGASPSSAPGASSVPSAAPGGSPQGSPPGSPGTAGAIEHPTGATDLVLRLEEGGGFTFPAFAMIQQPAFSLYGDGTVIYRAASEPFPEQKPGDPLRLPPLRVAKMTEAQMQALLADALGPGGLTEARERYDNMQVADAPTSIFSIDAGGLRRQVSVYALGFGPADPANPGPDDEILAAMAGFGERLRNFDQEIAKGNATEVGLYSPTRFRASLLEGDMGSGAVPRPWPWPLFGPDGFTAGDGVTTPGFPSRAIGGVEVSLLGIESPEGGLSGIVLRGPNGVTYQLGLRPLLPDEKG